MPAAVGMTGCERNAQRCALARPRARYAPGSALTGRISQAQ
jgi:hypothetical protein